MKSTFEPTPTTYTREIKDGMVEEMPGVRVHADEIDPVNGASHCYRITTGAGAQFLRFQHGPRGEEGSTPGIGQLALLAIVLDRLRSFQQTELANRRTAIAITHLETAILWLEARQRDRCARGVQGTREQ